MIYHIDYDKDRRKVACPVKNRQELLALRDSEKNLRILREYRSGKTDVKGDLLQLAYNIGHVNGLIAGCKSIGSHFFHEKGGNRSADDGKVAQRRWASGVPT